MSLRYPVPTATNTYKLEIAPSPSASGSLILRGITISSAYGTARWLMVLSAATIPSNGAVPIMAPIYVAANAVNISLELPDEGLKVNAPGIVLAASSTPGTLTVDTSATWEFSAFVEEWDIPSRETETTVGDLTTAVNGRTIWADSAGPKRLKQVNIKNLVASVRYAVVYAEDVPDSGSKIITWFKLEASENKEFNLGVDGLTPMQLDGPNTIRDGCVIYCQPDLTPGNLAVADDFNIQAMYV